MRLGESCVVLKSSGGKYEGGSYLLVERMAVFGCSMSLWKGNRCKVKAVGAVKGI